MSHLRPANAWGVGGARSSGCVKGHVSPRSGRMGHRRRGAEGFRYHPKEVELCPQRLWKAVETVITKFLTGDSDSTEEP